MEFAREESLNRVQVASNPIKKKLVVREYSKQSKIEFGRGVGVQCFCSMDSVLVPVSENDRISGHVESAS